MSNEELLAQMKTLTEAQGKTTEGEWHQPTPEMVRIENRNVADFCYFNTSYQGIANASFCIAAHNAPLAEWVKDVETMIARDSERHERFRQYAKEQDELLARLVAKDAEVDRLTKERDDLLVACKKALGVAEDWIYGELNGTSRYDEEMEDIEDIRTAIAACQK